jgi:hypothetical protein
MIIPIIWPPDAGLEHRERRRRGRALVGVEVEHQVAAQAAMAVCEMDACRRELDEVAAAIDGLQALAKAVGIDSDGCVREAKRRAEATRATYPAAIESVRDDVAAGRWAP